MVLTMEWEKLGQKQQFVSKKSVPVRSLRILDEDDNWHRYRICTVWDFNSEKFSSIPAVAKLLKDEQKRIALLITGRNGSFVKIGKRLGIQQSVFTSFNTINKKAQRSLLSQISYELFEENDLILGRETGGNTEEEQESNRFDLDEREDI